MIGLNQHRTFPGGAFDEGRAGLDHVGFAVTTRATWTPGRRGWPSCAWNTRRSPTPKPVHHWCSATPTTPSSSSGGPRDAAATSGLRCSRSRVAAAAARGLPSQTGRPDYPAATSLRPRAGRRSGASCGTVTTVRRATAPCQPRTAIKVPKPGSTGLAAIKVPDFRGMQALNACLAGRDFGLLPASPDPDSPDPLRHGLLRRRSRWRGETAALRSRHCGGQKPSARRCSRGAAVVPSHLLMATVRNRLDESSIRLPDGLSS